MSAAAFTERAPGAEDVGDDLWDFCFRALRAA